MSRSRSPVAKEGARAPFGKEELVEKWGEGDQPVAGYRRGYHGGRTREKHLFGEAKVYSWSRATRERGRYVDNWASSDNMGQGLR